MSQALPGASVAALIDKINTDYPAGFYVEVRVLDANGDKFEVYSGPSNQRSETSALIAARNFARMRSEERRMQVLSGGLGSAIGQKSVTGGLSG